MQNRRGFLKWALGGAFAVAAMRESWAQPYMSPNRFAGVSIVDQNLYRHPTLATQSDAPVGIQLALAMDTSGSMTDEEFSIELQASAHALNSELFRNAIKYKPGEKSVAICLVDFDSGAMVRIPWVDIRGEELNDKPYNPDKPGESSSAPDRLDRLTQEIANLPRRAEGGTTIEAAMELSRKLFLGCPWVPVEKRVLDVFGDGSSYPAGVARKRDELSALGVTVNGFAIINDEPGLDQFFRDNLVTKSPVQSPDGIYSEYGRVWAVARNLQAANNQPAGLKAFFEEVSRGMKQKITVEVAGRDTYFQTLTRVGEIAHQPVPAPVGRG